MASTKKGQAKATSKKKGSRKKTADPFLKKEWYAVKVPKFFPNDESKWRVGYTPAKKTGARKQLDNRVFEINLADLQKTPYQQYYEEKSWKKFKFVTEEIYAQQILTQWHGMEITRDKRCSLIRKWHSLIEAFVDCKTADGYELRIKAIAFTRRQLTQVRKNCYAKHSQIRNIRAKMTEIIKNHITSSSLEVVIKKLSEDLIGKDIQKRCQLVFPLRECLIEKVKVLKKPKRDVAKLMGIHDLQSPAFPPISAEEEQKLAEQAEQEEEAEPEAAAAGTAGGDNAGAAEEK